MKLHACTLPSMQSAVCRVQYAECKAISPSSPAPYSRRPDGSRQSRSGIHERAPAGHPAAASEDDPILIGTGTGEHARRRRTGAPRSTG